MTRAYLDHASTSTLRPAAAHAASEVYEAAAAGLLGDPSRMHVEGISARDTLEGARESVASWLGVRPRQVVFTSGATESIATASWMAWRDPQVPAHVVSSAVEHSAVRSWADRGPHTEVPVDHDGVVDPDQLAAACRDDTALVHLQWANHEVGTRQSVDTAAQALADARDTPGGPGARPLLHCDAAQAGPAAPQAVASGADLVSLSCHKLGAPAGIGVLVVRRNLRLPPLLVGGDQERARRGGLENIAGAVALAAVADELATGGDEELARLASLSERINDWAQ
ncbi:MAG: cysteine desulfurase family protein, partial [Microthrixaceae bacterium]